MKIGYIYMITSPTGRIYVGSSSDYIKRWADYRCHDCKYQRKLYNSFKKYGVENHIFEIIMKCSIEEMLKYETLIGWGFNVLEPENLNCKLPKLGEIYKVVSDETRKRMRESHKYRFKIMSEEKRNMLGKKRIGQKQSKEAIEQRTKAVQKPILQLDLENNLVKEWASSTVASKTLNISQSDIIQCCKKKKKTCGNFKWKYVNEELEELKYKPRKNRNNEFSKNKKSVVQMDLNGNFIKNWNCINDACRELNITASHISRCCYGKRNSAYGFKWKHNLKTDEIIFT